MLALAFNPVAALTPLLARAVPFELLLGAAQKIAEGLAAGHQKAEIARAVAPLVADLQVGEGYEAQREILIALVAGERRVRTRELKLLAEGTLALRPLDWQELSPDEALSRYRRLTDHSERLDPALWRPIQRPIESSNREVTILFTDLKGFTKASETMAPDDLQELLSKYIQAQTNAVRAHGGRVVKTIGDAVMAVFGAPVSHEDDADRAVRAALDMQRACKQISARLASEGRPNFEMRIGLHSGTVWAGEIEIEPGEFRLDLIGSNVNRAARTEPMAKPGTVFITEAVKARLAGRYVLAERGKLEGKKGRIDEITEEIPVYEAERALVQSEALAPRGTEQVRFIGREGEMASLRAAYQTVKDTRHAHLAVVAAPGGEGKSRLGAELIQAMQGAGETFTLLTAQGVDLAAKAPYAALVGCLRKEARISPEDDLGRQRHKLENLVLMTLGGTEEERVLPCQLLGKLMGIPSEVVTPEMEYLLQSPAELRNRTLDAVVALFDHMSREEMIFLVLEDLHWFDTGSLRFFQVILERLHDRPIFALGLTRPRFADERPPLMVGDRKDYADPSSELIPPPYPVIRTDLNRLSDQSLAEMVEEIVGEERLTMRVTAVNRPPEAVVEPGDPTVRAFLVSLTKDTDGSTYLLQEMARAIADGWRIQRMGTGRQWQFVSPVVQTSARGKASARAVPLGAEGFLQARIDVLPKQHQNVLRRASVMGREFSATDLHGVRLTVTDEILRELVRRKALLEVGEGRYQFPHDLLRETAYKNLADHARHRIHQLRADYLVAHGTRELGLKADELPALVAYHYEQAHDPSKAAHQEIRELAATHYSQAAELAFNRGANVTASDFYQRASELSGEPEKRLDALLGWDEALHADRQYRLELGVIETMETLTGYTNLPKEKRAMIFLRKGRTYLAMRDPAAEAAYHAGLSLYDASENTPTKCRLVASLGAAASELRRDYGSAARYYRDSLKIAELLNDRELMGMCFANLAYIGLDAGDYSMTLAMGQCAAEVITDARWTERLLAANVNRGSALMSLGQYEAALALFEETIGLSRARTGGRWLDYLLPNLAETARFLGHRDTLTYCQEAIQIHARHPDSFMAGVAHLYTALAYTDRNEWALASQEAEEVLRVANVKSDNKLKAMGEMALAQVKRGQGKVEEALAHSTVAYTLLEAANWQIEEFDLEIMLTQAQLLYQQGEIEAAWQVIDNAHNILQKRSQKISEEEHRKSFLGRVRVNQTIVQLWHAVRLARMEQQGALDRLLADLIFVVPQELPPELASSQSLTEGTASNSVPFGESYISCSIVKMPAAAVLRRLLTQDVTVTERNPGPAEALAERVGAVVGPAVNLWGQDIHWQPYFDAEGNTAAQLSFTIGGDPLFQGALDAFHTLTEWQGPNYELKLRGIITQGKAGEIRLTMRVAEGERLQNDRFGDITFILSPTTEGHTLIALSMQNRPFTRNPHIFLKAFLRAINGSGNLTT